MLRVALAALAAALVAFGAITWWALESSGVAVLETRAPDGTARRTHVWVAEANGGAWLEAATPERPWLRDVASEPLVRLERDGRSLAFRAIPEPGAAQHDRLRALLRARYGWRDAWVALLQDTSRGVAVRLEPVAPARS